MDKTPRARELRQASTEAEQAFWNQVRDRRLGGYRFRRQVSIGPYIADFVCPSAKLIVELDGGHHQLQETADGRRTQWLEGEGYRVLRFWNNDVLKNMYGVLEVVTEKLGTHSEAWTEASVPSP